MSNVIQLRPAKVMHADIDEADVRCEIIAYLTNMAQTLARRPLDGEIEMLLALNSSIAALLYSVQATRAFKHINDLTEELRLWEALQQAEKP